VPRNSLKSCYMDPWIIFEQINEIKVVSNSRVTIVQVLHSKHSNSMELLGVILLAYLLLFFYVFKLVPKSNLMQFLVAYHLKQSLTTAMYHEDQLALLHSSGSWFLSQTSYKSWHLFDFCQFCLSVAGHLKWALVKFWSDYINLLHYLGFFLVLQKLLLVSYCV